MPEKEKKKTWKQIQRERQLKLEKQRAQESERVKLKLEGKYGNGHKGYPKGKIFVAVCLIAVILISYIAWQSSIQASPTGNNGTINNSPVTPSTPATSSPSTGTAPNFSLKDINKTKTFSLSQHKGEVIAIHFMGLFGCSAQLYEINQIQLPELATVYHTYSGNKPVTVVTVGMATCAGCDDYLAQVRNAFGIHWTLGNDWSDQKLDIIQAYTTKCDIYDGTIVLVDKNLNVAEVYTDPITAAGLSARIDQLLLAC